MTPCFVIFDVGKTNKKVLVYGIDMKVMREETQSFPSIKDDDGDECDDIELIRKWVQDSWADLLSDDVLDIQGVNFTSYGASFIHLDKDHRVIAPLYSYLKEFPEDLKDKFFHKYGGRENICRETSSPSLGMLNSGLQLYWMKYVKPGLFGKITTSLHLPQYLSFLITGKFSTEYTSIGCHTMLWDFEKKDYHDWVKQEGISKLFPNLKKHSDYITLSYRDKEIRAGIGIHDSSAALIPYMSDYSEPFLLLSTGTWAITLNPFAQKPLTYDELKNDCLQFLSYRGNPVKAARLLLGEAHERLVRSLSSYYSTKEDKYKDVELDTQWLEQRMKRNFVGDPRETESPQLDFQVEYEDKSYSEAYHEGLYQLVERLVKSIILAGEDRIPEFKYLLVDGGFSRNNLFIKMLEQFLPDILIKPKESAQGTSEGAALILKELKK